MNLFVKKTLLVSFLIAFVNYSLACTTFLLKSNNSYFFGRNYDFVSSNGLVMVNNRNVQKSSFRAGNETNLSWVSKYGSITFNQFGKEFPQGGINEKGLVVELMWLEGTRYPSPDNRAGLEELQWIQYQLDNAATVFDVIASDKIVRIKENSAPLHFLVADSLGNTAVVEFLNGAKVSYASDKMPFPVLTNTPYSQAIEKKQSTTSPSFTDNSLQRFATACNMIEKFNPKHLKTNEVDYCFQILDAVSQEGFTQWSIVYDISSKKIYFSSKDNKKRKQVALADFNFSCTSVPLAIDINSDVSGNIFSFFIPMTTENNRKLISKTEEETKQILQKGTISVNERTDYLKTIFCKE